MNARHLFNACVAGAILTLLTASEAPAQDGIPYPEGQVVEITGAVANADGSPATGRTVVLEAFRRGFDMRDLDPRNFGRNKKGLVERTTTTDETGRYLFRWSWHEYWNRFEVSVGEFGREGFEVLARADLSQRILRGTPVRVSFVLGDAIEPGSVVGAPAAGPTRSAGSTSTPAPTNLTAAQRDVRSREGGPDKVEALELPYGREITWWYFSAGRGYRFLDGELTDELTFDPVSN